MLLFLMGSDKNNKPSSAFSLGKPDWYEVAYPKDMSQETKD
jgi:hypothetical protein